jgi:hypothetical protein
MSRYPIKRNKADILFSDYIRKKAKWRCEYCKRVCRDWSGTTVFWRLEASHYFVRSHWSVRYDERNVHALCSLCHEKLGEYRNDESGPYDLWMKKLLGEKGYQKLKIDANTTARRDPKLWLLYVKQLINKNNE